MDQSPTNTFALGFAPCTPAEYNNEHAERQRQRRSNVTRTQVRQRLMEIYDAVNVAAMCRETGLSRPFVIDLVKDVDKERIGIKPHQILTIWLDKYEPTLKSELPAIRARRQKFKEYNERRRMRQANPDSAPARTVIAPAVAQRAVKTLNLMFDLGKADMLADLSSNELAKLARSLASAIRGRQTAGEVA